MSSFIRVLIRVAGVTVAVFVAYRALVNARTSELSEFLDEEDFWDEPPDPQVQTGEDGSIPSDSALNDTSWVLESWADGSEVPTEPVITLEIRDGLVVGRACNTYRGPVEIDNGTFRLAGPLASTRMACIGPIGDAEPIYHVLLASVDSYTLTEATLELSAGGSVVLTYKPA